MGPGFEVHCTAADAAHVESVLRTMGVKFIRRQGGTLVVFSCNGNGDKAAAALGVENKWGV